MFECYSGRSETDVYDRRHHRVTETAGGLQGRETADRQAGQGTRQFRKEDGIQDTGPIKQEDHEWKEESEEESEQAAGTIVIDYGDLLRAVFKLRGEG